MNEHEVTHCVYCVGFFTLRILCDQEATGRKESVSLYHFVVIIL